LYICFTSSYYYQMKLGWIRPCFEILKQLVEITTS